MNNKDPYKYFLGLFLDGKYTVYGFNDINDVTDRIKLADEHGILTFFTTDVSLISGRSWRKNGTAEKERGEGYH